MIYLYSLEWSYRKTTQSEAREFAVLLKVRRSRMTISESYQVIEQIRDYNVHLRGFEMYSHLKKTLECPDYSNQLD